MTVGGVLLQYTSPDGKSQRQIKKKSKFAAGAPVEFVPGNDLHWI